jgi:signal transduction histidine kinase
MALHATSKATPTVVTAARRPDLQTAMRGILDRSSIATRLVFFAVALVGVTAMSIGTLSYTRARHALETGARTNLVLLARDVAANVHEELEDRAADITHWSRLEVMRALIYQDVDKELAKFLEQTLRGRPAYRAIVCLDGAGRPIAGAGAVGEIEPQGQPGKLLVSIIPRSGDSLAQFEMPVFNPERSTMVIGRLIVLLDLSALLETVDPSQRGETADVSLLLRVRDGETLAESEARSERVTRRDGAPPAMLTALAPVEGLPIADGPPLEVLVSEPVEAAFADVASLRATLLQTGLLVVVLGALLAAFVAWRIGQPIRQLTVTVREVTKRGEAVPQSMFPETGGEVGVLASAFRTMMDSLSTAQREAMAQSRLAFLGEIAANIAHEVRTPLSVLKTAAQLLARGGVPEPEQRELALTAASEVDRLNAVVTSLVDLARPKPVQHRLEAVDPIVDRAVAFFKPLAAKSGVEIVRAGAHDGSRILGSADQLYQVLLNLVQNAIQAMRGAGTVTVTSGRVDGWVLIGVEDTGPGFAVDVLPRVFSPFFTTKVDGTGLGLAIVKRMVEEHGGTVGAENRSRGGARVWVRLPVREDAT